MKKKVLAVAFGVMGMMLWSPVFGQSSKDYAIMARSSWSAFECAVLSSSLKNNSETERLFEFGYRQGRAFVEAFKQRKIDTKDWDSEVPWVIGPLLQGPTTDFILGRIYETSVKSALSELPSELNAIDQSDVRRLSVQNKYNSKNCRLIGAAR